MITIMITHSIFRSTKLVAGVMCDSSDLSRKHACEISVYVHILYNLRVDGLVSFDVDDVHSSIFRQLILNRCEKKSQSRG